MIWSSSTAPRFHSTKEVSKDLRGGREGAALCGFPFH